jgi:hypothetical protein
MVKKKRIQEEGSRLAIWLRPGIHVKRWIIILFLGILCLILGMGYLMVHTYRTFSFPHEAYYITLQFIDRLGRGVIFFTVVVALAGLAIWQLSRSVIIPLMPDGKGALSDILYRYRTQEK